MHPRSPLAPQGFTLLEVLVALVILATGLLGLSANAALVSRLVGDGSRLILAATVAADRLETLRAMPCASMSSGSAESRGIEERWAVASLGSPGQAPAMAIELSVTYPLRTPRGPDSTRTQRFRGAILCRDARAP